MEELTERADTSSPTEMAALSTWQNKLLPLMVSMLIVLTLFFCISNIIQVYVINNYLQREDELKLEPVLSPLAIDEKTPPAGKLNYTLLRTQATLEGQAMKYRHHQANVAMMGRIYIIYLGFITGMVLAMVGATFVLGKLRERQSQVKADSTLFKVSMASASPGLVLAMLGTMLMLTTIWVRSDISVKDPLYLNAAAAESPNVDNLLDESERIEEENRANQNASRAKSNENVNKSRSK
jgi:hypothetical protein